MGVSKNGHVQHPQAISAYISLRGHFSIPHKTKLKAAYIACMAPTDEGLAMVASYN